MRPEHRVLEIGTGSGYQAAVLAELAAELHDTVSITLRYRGGSIASINSDGDTSTTRAR